MDIGANIRRVGMLFVVLFLAISGGLVYWQIPPNIVQAVTSNPHNSRVCQVANTPKRGNIYDSQGVLLAYDVPDNNVCGGFIRHYTDPSLANLIGYYVPGYPLPAGTIEQVYNNVLEGKDNQSDLTSTVNSALHVRTVGDNIYLTINDRIQKIVAQDFQYDDEPIDDNLLYKSDKGAVIISNPHTGQMLAMYSSPSYNPNEMVQDLVNNNLSYYNSLVANPEDPLLDRPLDELSTPGSTFKTATLMAALDSGHTSLNQEWSEAQANGTPDNPNGGIIVDGTLITGNNLAYNDGSASYTFHFPVSTAYGFENSDNLIFAQVTLNTGQSTWLNYMKKFYIDKQVPFDLPVAESTVENANGQPLSQIQFATDGFGQGVDDITPFQMALVNNTVANNGVMMRPMLISKITNPQGQTLQNYSSSQLSTVTSVNTAEQVRQAMLDVAKCGGGYPITDIRNTPWGIIGKTGTGQVGGNTPAEGWFITQAPYYINNPDQMPALTITAVKYNAGEGAYAVGPMEAKMYNDIFSAGYVKVTQPNNPTPDAYCIPQGLIQTN
ncbi:MAG TPA: penicillin-binding transpeptidase domain-containing protein [Dictyobacter sp.]|jgi:cell division protein FtsI/penicillin-binding protein 2|nr:penicillin-binding transpeptidase domain-containing protein [Dictyobacter sp.]